ncbi:MAG: hypothetical protein ABSH09_12420 [Bryobacteraceae bacterium]|jgi:hypothetical protein
MAFLKQIGLNSNDLAVLITALDSFNTGYASLIAQYNATAEAAITAGTSPDVAGFWAQRNSFVQKVRDQLQGSLSKQGIALLDARIQEEKSHMKVAAMEAQ